MSVEADYRERIGRARAMIESRLDEDVPLEELAAAACFSMFHFHRVFRGMTGETVREHARRLRLERAAHRLTRTGDDILRVALDSGYGSHEAFTRAFGARFGVAPSVFREERRAVIAHERGQKGAGAMEVRIEEMAPARVAYVRHVGPYTGAGEAWSTLMKWGWSKMVFGKAQTFGMCWDDPEVTAPEKIRYDACMVVGDKAKVKGDVQLQDVPGGTFCVALHEGAYERLGETYAGLCAAVCGGEVGGRRWRLGDPPSLERYLNDPRKTKPEDLRTEVWMRIERA